MRVRQIFLVVSVVTMVCGCSGGNADGQMGRCTGSLWRRQRSINKRRSI